MIKQQIKGFDILAEGKTLPQCAMPASYPDKGSLHKEDGVCYGTNRKSYVPATSAVFTAELEVTTLIMSFDKVQLKLGRTGAPMTVEVNGYKVGSAGADNLAHSFNVKNYLHVGGNSLKITLDGSGFKSTEYCISPFSIGECEIVAYNHALVGTVSVSQEHRENSVRLFISLDSFDVSSGVRAVATLVSPGGRVYFCGMSGGKGVIDVSDPNLWWPRGLGVQNLYKLTVNLYYDNEIIDSRDIRLGLCSYSLKNVGEKPLVEINGTPVFSRGACYLPDSIILPMLDEGKTRSLIKSVCALGFNTLVVPDLGVYPTELFYTLCDEEGIMVWHEVRCEDDAEAKYRELEDNLKPVACHPSMALLIYTHGTPCEDIRAIFPDTCSIVIDSLDAVLTEPVASLPELCTLRKFAPPSDINIFSPTLEEHSTLADNASLMSSSQYKCPRGIGEQIYVTALRAKDGIEKKIKLIRRENSEEKSLVLSRLCDPSPMISPSVVDAFGKVKSFGFAMRVLFGDVYLGAVNEGTRVTFFVSNETKAEYNGRFDYTVYHASGRVLFHDGFDITARALSSSDILTVDLDEVIGDRTDECFVYYRLSDSFITTSSGTVFFVPSKQFKYCDPHIKTEISGSGRDFVLTVSSEGYACRVFMELSYTDATLSDNLFDVVPGGVAGVEIKTEHATAIEVLRRELKTITLYDLGKD